ncbi:MAG: hypothetical protein GY761_18710, partial [Hyphomicrobiales bacterium]|nr:hypothetical protein [Hyphomicrobiales bacterium]
MSEIGTWELAIDIEAPFATVGVQQEAYGYDISLLRDYLGRLVISGDQIEGVVLHLMKQMHVPEMAWKQWFGNKNLQFADNENVENFNNDIGSVATGHSSATLKISDLVLCDPEGKYHIVDGDYTRIAIDDETGASKKGAVIVIEQPFNLGQKLTFLGKVRLPGKND